MKLVKLSSVCSARVGYTFKSRVDNNNEGDIKILTVRHINDDFALSNLDRVKQSELEFFNEGFLLSDGDIAVKSIGNFFSICLSGIDSKVIASIPIIVIKTNANVLLPEYLTYLLNSDYGSNYFRIYNTGTHMPSIRIKQLMEMKITLPPLKVQQEVVAINKLLTDEVKLVARKMELKRRLTHAKIKQTIKF